MSKSQKANQSLQRISAFYNIKLPKDDLDILVSLENIKSVEFTRSNESASKRVINFLYNDGTETTVPSYSVRSNADLKEHYDKIIALLTSI